MEPSHYIPQVPSEQLLAWEEEKKLFEERKKRLQEEGQQRFRALFPATALYALFYTFCIYRNLSGIMVPLWIGATILYACYILKNYKIPVKREGIFYMAAMVLLGISTVFTGNPYIIVLNYLGFFLLLLSFLLHTMYDDRDWGIGTYLMKIARATFGAVGKLSVPLNDGCSYRLLLKNARSRKWSYVLMGTALAVPCSIFLALLLGSADAIFQDFLIDRLARIALPGNWLGVLLLFLFAFMSAYCGLCELLQGRKKEASAPSLPAKKKLEPIIAISFTTPISLLYVLFSLIQVFCLFLGFGTLPEGITYAEYARSGFFQLLFICFINFILVLFVKSCVKESKMLLRILLAICCATFIMIASSAYRLFLYIGTYQLTFLRILALTGLAVIGFLMAGVVLSLFKSDFPLFRYCLASVSILYLALSFSHADYFIASYNLSHADASSLTDTLSYIGTLSSDAAPAIADYLSCHKALQEKADAAYQSRNQEGYWADEENADTFWYLCYTQQFESSAEYASFRTFNVSKYVASKVLHL